MRFLRPVERLTIRFENNPKEYTKQGMSNNRADNSDRSEDLSKYIVEAINELGEQNEKMGSFSANND